MKDSILLKPLMLPKETVFTELAKLDEEVKEFKNGLINEDPANIIEEFHDVVQVMLNVYIIAGYDINQLIDGQVNHFIKLENRGYKFYEKN